MKHRVLTSDQVERVRRLLLHRAQTLIGEMQAHTTTDPSHGRSPLFWRVAECDAKTDNGMVLGSEIAIWIVTADSIVPAPAGSIRQPGDRDGMYHKQGHGTFFLHPTEMLCWFDYQVGPRYGSGCRIQLATSPDGTVFFSREQGTWIS